MARITTEQKVRVTVQPLTASGKPAKIDGSVKFTSSDEAVASVTAENATSATVVAVAEGAAQIVATFDADLGEGVREITASGALEVVSPEAESAEIVFGTPEPQ